MTVLSNIITPSNVLTTTNTATVTNKTFGDNPTFSGGTANGVTFLNGSKVLTSGSALTFDGSQFKTSVSGNTPIVNETTGGTSNYLQLKNTGGSAYIGSVSNDMAFYTSGAATEQMRLTSTGLGIGTSSPSDILTLAGGASGSYGLTINNAKVGGGTKAIFQYDTTNQIALVGGNTTNGLAFQTLTSGSLTTKATLDTSGNLGLGVTPSAWNTGYKAFVAGGTNSNNQVGGIASGSGITIVSTNYYRSTAPSDLYAGTGFAMQYKQISGEHQFYTAASGTAGNAITFTQAMTLDASGNLMVGTTTQLARANFAESVISGEADVLIGNSAGSGTNNTAALYLSGQNTLVRSAAIKAIMGTSSEHSLAFFTNGAFADPAERARIDSSGNLLVGTTSAVPGSPTRGNFYNASSASAVVGIQNARNVSGDIVNGWFIGSNCNNTSSYFLQCGVTGVANVFYIYGNGNVQNTNNSYGGISDVKLKENIVDASPKLADLMQVKVRNYNLIGDTNKQIGVVAQELEEVFPAMVDESPDRDAEGNDLGTTTKAVKYSVFVPMLIKALQEQQALIVSLKARLDAANL